MPDRNESNDSNPLGENIIIHDETAADILGEFGYLLEAVFPVGRQSPEIALVDAQRQHSAITFTDKPLNLPDQQSAYAMTLVLDADVELIQLARTLANGKGMGEAHQLPSPARGNHTITPGQQLAQERRMVTLFEHEIDLLRADHAGVTDMPYRRGEALQGFDFIVAQEPEAYPVHDPAVVHVQKGSGYYPNLPATQYGNVPG